MVRDCNRRSVFGCALVVALCLSGVTPADAQFTSGSSGAHGPFPPPQDGTSVHTTAPYIVWNVTTGAVRYCSSYALGSGSDQCNAGSTTNVLVQIPNIPAGGLTTGIYEFSDVNIAASGTRRVVFIGTSPNVPVTILSQNDITLGSSVFFHLNGETPPNTTSNFAEAGARGGPGGFDGGASGNGGATPGHGSAGYGPAGGAAGRADATSQEALNAASAGPAPLNVSLTPLTGGSGGGGGAGLGQGNTAGCTGVPILGYGGGPGGGGGGALLLAATNRITLSQSSSILAHGGNGARNGSSTCQLLGGGGGGGSVRLVARELTGNGGINVSPGVRNNGTSPAIGGHVRIEASLNSYSGSISGAVGGSFLSFPTAALPSNQPLLRITSLGGSAAPASPSASLVSPDINFQSPVEGPVALDVAASNVPVGTVVSIRVVPAVGQPLTATTTALAGTFANSTATASVTLPPGPGVVTASASFSITGGGGGGGGGGAAFNVLPLIDGKPFERVEVAALADGTSRTYLIAKNGVRFELGTGTR